MHVFKEKPLGRAAYMIPLIYYIAHQITPNKLVGLTLHIWETSYPKMRSIWCRINPRARGYISAIPIWWDWWGWWAPQAGGASKGCTKYGSAVWSDHWCTSGAQWWVANWGTWILHYLIMGTTRNLARIWLIGLHFRLIYISMQHWLDCCWSPCLLFRCIPTTRMTTLPQTLVWPSPVMWVGLTGLDRAS